MCAQFTVVALSLPQLRTFPDRGGVMPPSATSKCCSVRLRGCPHLKKTLSAPLSPVQLGWGGSPGAMLAWCRDVKDLRYIFLVHLLARRLHLCGIVCLM